ncbi:hypothetical protein PV646_06585 [Streptomyces sp. ID05-26A]|nr:hypothetical protein [Streptomyces sp. ID05-26A]
MGLSAPPPALALEQGPQVCAKHAANAGFGGEHLIEAIAIGMGESDCRSYFDDPTPADQGTWQLQYNASDPWRNGTYGNLQDPAYNARATHHISSGGTNWRPWSTYTQTSSPRYYRKYLDVSRAAAAKYLTSRSSSDMNANGMTDFVTFTPGDATWHILFNDGSEYHRSWGGLPEDLPVSGDFNANNLSDFTIYRPSTGTFHILYDNGSQYTRQWGGPGHVPVSGDFNGNGMTDFVTYTASDGYFHILYNDGSQYHRKWGGPGHLPVAGDFDGNGMTDFATFTPSDGYFHILYNDGREYHRPWGQNGDIPVSGDFNANGLSDFTVYRPSTGEWHILYDNGSHYFRGRPWGGYGHIPPA